MSSAAYQLIQRERNQQGCHSRDRMLLSMLPAALIRALDTLRVTRELRLEHETRKASMALNGTIQRAV